MRRVAGGDVLRSLVRRLAGVVGGLAPVVPPHAQSADSAAKEPAVEVVTPGGRTGDGGGHCLTGAFVGPGASLDGVVLLTGDDGRVGGLLGPDPGLGRVGAVVALLAGSSVPDLVAGVLGVP